MKAAGAAKPRGRGLPAGAARGGAPVPGLYVPLWVALGYLFGTLAIFLVLPIDNLTENLVRTDTSDTLLMVGFVTVAYLCFYFGYVRGVSRYERPAVVAVTPPGRVVALLNAFIIAAAVYHVAWASAQLAMSQRSLGDVLSGLADPGAAYRKRIEMDRYLEGLDTPPNAMAQVLTIFGLFNVAFLPTACLCWGWLSRPARWATAAGTAIFAGYYLTVGTVKGLGDIAIYIAAGLLLRFYSTWRVDPRAGGVPVSRAKAIGAAAGGVVLFVTFMSYVQSSRLDTLSRQQAQARASESVLGLLIGNGAAAAFERTLSYPTHGYQGLIYDLKMPFEWTYGLGNSMAATAYAKRYAGFDVTERTYLARAEIATGWPARMNWSTIFPWVASDVTFLGCFPFMYLAGWLWARSWVEATATCRLSSAVLFAHMCLFVVFIPANNQVVQTPISLWGTAGLMAWWVFDHMKSPGRR